MNETANSFEYWRPPQHIRVKAVAIVLHEGRLLLCEVLNDDGMLKGWCPLGGGAEFGETAEVALKREIAEELRCEATILGSPIICENIYRHEGATGHEIVFAFPVRLENPDLYRANRFMIREDRGSEHWVEWIPLRDFADGRAVLFPAVLQAQLSRELTQAI